MDWKNHFFALRSVLALSAQALVVLRHQWRSTTRYLARTWRETRAPRLADAMEASTPFANAGESHEQGYSPKRGNNTNMKTAQQDAPSQPAPTSAALLTNLTKIARKHHTSFSPEQAHALLLFRLECALMDMEEDEVQE